MVQFRYRKYGVSKKDYDNMLKNQDYKCKICRQVNIINKRTLDVDHCHKTNKIRGLLCQKCNRGIGLLNDNPVLCARSALYLNGEL